MSHAWEPMDSAPNDRPIVVAGGTYHYEAGRKPSIYDAGPSLRLVKWDGIGWKHTTISTRYESPLWWIDPLPPVPQDNVLSQT
jgi:hypothetical protein